MLSSPSIVTHHGLGSAWPDKLLMHRLAASTSRCAGALQKKAAALHSPFPSSLARPLCRPPPWIRMTSACPLLPLPSSLSSPQMRMMKRPRTMCRLNRIRCSSCCWLDRLPRGAVMHGTRCHRHTIKCWSMGACPFSIKLNRAECFVVAKDILICQYGNI